MDTNELIASAKARFSHNSAKAYLKDKFESKFITADQNGLWTANLQLINFLNAFDTDTLILIDNFGNPVEVIREPLLEKLKLVYHTTMKEWYDEWKTLESKR